MVHFDSTARAPSADNQPERRNFRIIRNPNVLHDLQDQEPITIISGLREEVGKGNYVAARRLAVMFDEGKFVRPNEAVALKWHQVAENLKSNSGVQVSGVHFESAEEHFQEAAKWNHGFKQVNSEGNNVFVDADPVERIYHLHQAVKKGPHAEAMTHIGSLYYHQNSLKQDLQLAAKWFEKGATAEKPSVLGQSLIGQMYCRGEGVPQDQNKGVAFLDLAIKAGHYPALYHLLQLKDESGRSLSPLPIVHPDHCRSRTERKMMLSGPSQG